MDCHTEQVWESAKKREGNEEKFGMDAKSPLVPQPVSPGEPQGWDPADEEDQAPRNVHSPVRNCRCPKRDLELGNGNCKNIHNKINLNTHLLTPAVIRIFLIAVDLTRLQVFYLFSRTLPSSCSFQVGSARTKPVLLLLHICL